jgi:type IV pilus assembly protein PilX
MRHTLCAPRSLPRQQRGVTLIIALIVLLIIGLTSVSVMRGALVSDQIANNTRTQVTAAQAADLALRYCESQLSAAGATAAVTLLPAPAAGAAAAWESAANWFTGGKKGVSVNEVPASVMGSANSTVTYSTLPQCIIERAPAALGSTVYVVTARGFSPDYHANSNTGRTDAGSAVWVQSTVKF